MKKLTDKQFTKHVSIVKVPEGFTSEMTTVKSCWGPNEPTELVFVLKSDDVKIEFDQNGSGHTHFKTGDGWLCFDRRGIEDSFYHLPLYEKDTVKDINEIVAKQLVKIGERREYHKTAVKIPDVGYTTSPEGVEKLKAQMKKVGNVSFHPSGFGTGYRVTKKTLQRYGVRRAKPELETFFGVSPLWVESFDAD